MSEVFLRPAFLAPVALLTIYLFYTIYRSVKPSNLPSLPIVGTKPSDWFPLLQARWRNSTNYRDVADQHAVVSHWQQNFVRIWGCFKSFVFRFALQVKQRSNPWILMGYPLQTFSKISKQRSANSLQANTTASSP